MKKTLAYIAGSIVYIWLMKLGHLKVFLSDSRCLQESTKYDLPAVNQFRGY